MCNTNPNLDAAFAEMEATAERLSNTQEKMNKPLFDLLFKLAEYPQTDALAGVKVKTLHTYAHRFIEFYMTECPDGVSVHTINSSKVHDIAENMRALGDGLTRLCEYLGLKAEADELTEYVDTLALAYDTFSAMMNRVEECRDEFYDDEEYYDDEEFEDDEYDEDDEDDEECDTCDCDSSCKNCCGSQDTNNQPDADEDDVSDEELDKLINNFFSLLASGLAKKKSEQTAADTNKQNAEKEFEQTFGKQPEPKAVPTEEEMVKKIASIFGINPECIQVKKQPVQEQPKPRDNPEEIAKHIARMLGINPADIERMFNNAKPRQVAPGCWRIEF